MSLQTILVEQLQIGHFIRLDGAWMDSPFMLRSFKIKTTKQIRIIHKMGVKTIDYDPERSDIQAVELDEIDFFEEDYFEEEDPVVVEVAEEAPVVIETIEADPVEKKNRIQKQKKRRVSLNRCEKAFTESASAVKNLMQGMRARPKESLVTAEKLVSDIVETAIDDQDATVQLVNMKGRDESNYFHAVNVTMLSLIVGKELGLDDLEMKHLGVGAMLHDFGQQKIPDKILRKTSALTTIERKVYELHTRYGLDLARKIGRLPKAVIKIIEQHHEFEDGSGYPNKLKSGQISKLSKIVAVTNAYDDYCNSPHNEKHLTPYEAMSQMYSEEKYDKNILSIFINRLGVYPPGTLVMLSDGSIAGVTAVNHEDLLHPQLVLYDVNVPKEEAAIIDLSEEGDLKIEKTIRRNEVPSEVLPYLNFGDSVNYFVDPSANK